MRTATPEEILEKFHRNRDKKSQEFLILHYRFLVKRIAKKMAASMPVSAEDLESDGIFGLIDALDKYDPSKGVRFEIYAVTRIRGAIIDAIRSRDHVPRSFRFKESKIQNAIDHLSQVLGHEPTVEEISDFTKLSLREISDTYRMCSPAVFGKIDSAGEDFVMEGIRFADKEINGPGESIDVDTLREMLADSFRGLQEREQVLFALYYNEGMPLSDIGVIFGITEARASQIHIKAIRELYSKVLP